MGRLSSIEDVSQLPTIPATGRQWKPFEIAIPGPAEGNPFIDVELVATFESPEGAHVRVGGFYDGDGVYRIRLLPSSVGEWRFTTTSTAESLDAITGSFRIEESDAPGPVRVDGFHFRHADGSRHLPLGTTAYAWTHQAESLQERTLASLAEAPFTKIRMCVFPKSYLYNSNEPERYPFTPDGDGGFDTSRFDPVWWTRFEQRIRDLDALGIQADVILYHPYDRWGFSDLGSAADDRYVRYAARRLAALPNVWWSMANEYDLVRSKGIDDWERLADILVEEDHADHLISIHNCFEFYDHTRPWITHASVQRIDVYRTAENTDAWREQWGKPVVVDECGYEGDLDQGWGNITAEEMVRRFWEGAVRGGYVGHGETYYDENEVIWWSKGAELRGDSPARIAFLAQVTSASPTGVLDPLKSEWDAPWGGVEGRYAIIYFGFNRPRFRTVSLPPGQRWNVDILDTWNMTIDRLPGEFEGTFTVTLPGRQYIALRCSAVEPAALNKTGSHNERKGHHE